MKPLQFHHTFGLRASCNHLLSIENQRDISLLLSAERSMVLGEGSNCIFVSDYAGTVAVNRLKGIDVKESNANYEVTVSSGENWHQLVVFCLANDIAGLENLALIPGTVGAAPIQNIGAYGREVSQFITHVKAIDRATGEPNDFSAQECEFGYRESVFKKQPDKWFITAVTLVLPKKGELETSYGELKQIQHPTPQKIFDKVCEIRRAKLPDPTTLGNAGSFFKNPVIDREHWDNLRATFPNIPSFVVSESQVKVPAAWLIDQCGFKGKEYGGVRCHPTQPLVLTNYNSASGDDVLGFARNIVQKVEQQFDIRLENEVRLIGSDGLIEL